MLVYDFEGKFQPGHPHADAIDHHGASLPHLVSKVEVVDGSASTKLPRYVESDRSCGRISNNVFRFDDAVFYGDVCSNKSARNVTLTSLFALSSVYEFVHETVRLVLFASAKMKLPSAATSFCTPLPCLGLGAA